MDYTVHGILQARVLECIAFAFSRGSSQGPNPVSCIAGAFFTSWATREALNSFFQQHRDDSTHEISRGSSQARDQTQVSRIAGGFFTS